jgi:L-amino acid N-acyltransferase YncA
VNDRRIRLATPDDADAIAAIYAPVVVETAISFETEPPDPATMRARITATLELFPWLVCTEGDGAVIGYVYASRHRERAAYRWSVDTTAYVHRNARGQGVGRALYEALLKELAVFGYFQAFAGITLPNAASVALHEAVGFAPLGVYRNVGYKLGAWHDVGWWQRTLQPARAPAEPRAFGGAP